MSPTWERTLVPQRFGAIRPANASTYTTSIASVALLVEGHVAAWPIKASEDDGGVERFV